jgi:ATP-dependent Clp protease adaptor protein ClpS
MMWREADMSDTATTKPAKRPVLPSFKPRQESDEQTQNQTKKLPPYNVVLLNDDDHTYEYVIEMLHKIFAHSFETAFNMAKTVDEHGRVIVLTTHKEKAELKRDQILAYGKDPRIEASAGSMSAMIEPAC